MLETIGPIWPDPIGLVDMGPFLYFFTWRSNLFFKFGPLDYGWSGRVDRFGNSEAAMMRVLFKHTLR
jgi:hypothetical protein